jgi:hypothetical protein
MLKNRGLLALWRGGCYPAKSGGGEGGEEAVAHEAPFRPARPRHQLPAGGEAAGASTEAARFGRRRRFRRRHGRRDKRESEPYKTRHRATGQWGRTDLVRKEPDTQPRGTRM